MVRRKRLLGRLHASAARRIYRGARQNGGTVPWLAILVIAAGFGAGALADTIMHAQGWTPIDSNRGVIWGLVISVGWVLFALAAGGGYGSDDQ